MGEQPTLFALPTDPTAGSNLVEAAKRSVQALRDQNAIQEWHEIDVAVVIELAERAQRAKGIAQAQLYAQLLAARAKLPEPIVQETDDVIRYEADRELDWFRAHGDPADLPNAPQPASVL